MVRPGEPVGEREVVGEVADMRFFPGEDSAARANVYEPLAQSPPSSTFGVIVRAPAGADFQPGLRAAVARLDAAQPLYGYDTWNHLLAAGLAGDRTFAWFLAGLDGLVLLSTAIGLYGIVAFAAARRRKEMAIRMAIGASRAATTRLLLAGGARLAAIGVAAGLALSWLDSIILASAFNAIPTRTFAIFAFPAALLLALVLGASLIPAHRAASAEPLALLKEA